jgi:hypothetical protein
MLFAHVFFLLIELSYVGLISFILLEAIKCKLYMIFVMVTPVLIISYIMILASVFYVTYGNNSEDSDEGRNPFFGLRISTHATLAFIIYYFIQQQNNCVL